MNSSKLISLFNQPSLLEKEKTEDFIDILEVYPFFTQARLLLTKKMQLSQHLLLKKEIQKTAVSVQDRKSLYEFLYQKDIQKTIIASEKEEETENRLTETEEPSSFVKPVEIEKQKEPESSFKKPIDLKNFGNSNTNSLDALEQQIIGQTIEHVLTQEIAMSNSVISTEQPNETNPKENKASQKFSDWLTILDQERLKNWRKSDIEFEDNQEVSEKNIIDSFLEKDMNVITPTNDNIEYTPSNLARLSIVDDEDFITETLAEIYLKQGNVQKALSAYNRLLLKYPEKKTYFAAQIEKIEKDLK
ncbi:MAG: tetratricopeptide repeat protein [Salibacteraceae bacterium]